jgi:hypothetical protein
MYCIGNPPRLLTAIVGCSVTEVLASTYPFVNVVSLSAIHAEAVHEKTHKDTDNFLYHGGEPVKHLKPGGN